MSAIIMGTWEEWDGKLLGGGISSKTDTDPGAHCWKVTYKETEVSVLGRKVTTNMFPEAEASRIY